MPTSQFIGTEDIARENLDSQTDQPAEPIVLPPFSRKVRVDKELKLRNEDFKNLIDVFFIDKDVTVQSQLTATPAFPTPYVLAQFASKSYKVYKTGETDAQYETRLALPDGWKLLTTASNTGMINGYFGAAYWHPEHQHVVIAHRGTKFSSLGALYTDIIGVCFKHRVPQMDSASTFAYKVVEVLRDVDHEKGTNFQVFFTGHSLGGWLAQITTFTTKYLKIEGSNFLRSDNVPHSYHSHTKVFDSPGCKHMLSQMARKFDVRLYRRSIDLDHLDITSYLSTPNLINTRNDHLGTVYHIVVDLSDMSWWERNTALYNKATHSMKKIVEVFDPETGQVRKDEQGKLKAQEVIDWPLSSCLSCCKEYNNVSRQRRHLNEYDTDRGGENSMHEDYLPIRYQTTTYVECENSLSIFSQEEQQFLNICLVLRPLPEFLKPKEMFSAMKNDQEQEKAEKLLQSFKIRGKKICCTDASTLQALIPYVKRLLQLFPEVKENSNCFFKQEQIWNNAYHFVTKRYVEDIHKSPFEFDTDALKDFLNNEFLKSYEKNVLILRIIDGDAWTGLINVYRGLEKTLPMTDFLSEGHYIVLTLHHLLLVNPMVNLNTLINSTTPHLLMMACETNQQPNDETKQIFESLFKTLEQKQSNKIILTTQSEGDTFTFLQELAKETLSNGFVKGDEKLTWSKLTPSSQEKLLENAVYFQGSEIALNQLISPDSPVTNVLPLADLLGKKHIQICEEPVACSKSDFYDERYYIDRTFTHRISIKHDILNDNREQTFPDLLVNTEQEFKELCHDNPKSNVHWLEKDKSGNLVWQQSQGSLETLRKYINTHSSHTYTADDLDKLLKQAEHRRVMLISDTAGMGKSTVLTHLCKQIKQKFPAKWVVRIHLNDHTKALNALKRGQIDKEKAIEFVSEKILKLKSRLDMQLFKQCCEQKQKVDIVIMLDGFDEISSNYRETVIALLQALRQTAVEQLWVTTRPHLREELEDELQQHSYTLEPFSGKNQVEFLTKFWRQKDWFTEMNSKEKKEKEFKLEIYAAHLIDKLAQSISDKDNDFTGIPLQCRMLAEAFDEEVKTLSQSAESVPQLQFSLDLIGLYEAFMNRKYEIWFEKKFKLPMTDVNAETEIKTFVQNKTEEHQMLALKMLFSKEQVALLQINSQYTSLDEDVNSTGIAQVSDDDKLHFIHHTFAEYYVAVLLVNKLTKESNTSQQVQDFLLQKIFLEEDFRGIRAFIDGLFSRSAPSKEALKLYGNRINVSEDRIRILHQAAHEGNAHIFGFLLDSLQAGEHTETVNKLLLAEDHDGRTAWNLASARGHIVVLKKLWECAQQRLKMLELKTIS